MKKMKKILFIGAISPPVTGQSLACEVFIKELNKYHFVEIVNLSKNNFKSGKFEKSRLKEIFFLIYKIWRSARKSDAVYFTISESVLGNLKDLLIYFVTWKMLPKSAVHLHGGAGMKNILAGRFSLMRLINKFFLSRVGRVIVLGDRLKSIYNGIVDDEKILIVKNFAENRYVASERELNEKFRSFSKLRILYLSNMIPEKGYLHLRDAIKNLNLRHSDKIYLDFAGGFINQNDKELFLRSISEDPYINYHGVVHADVKRQLLIQSHILALPTFYPYEGQPISILEAYAAGCAVLTTDHSGIFDIFTPTLNGWEVDKDSQKSIETTITYCLGNITKVETAGRFNTKFARENFTTEKYNSELIKIMNILLQGRG